MVFREGAFQLKAWVGEVAFILASANAFWQLKKRSTDGQVKDYGIYFRFYSGIHEDIELKN